MINKKISILLNWSRELDMYNNIINKLPEDKLEIIVNDIKTSEKERKGNTTEIKNILQSRKKNFKYFSEIYNKEKYEILISTGHANSLKISFYSILRFFYGQTIGRLLDITRISKLLIKIFDRPFTADGKKSRIGLIWYPEKKIGKTVIKFPTDMDLKLKHYPYKSFENNFDIFFTHSDFETSLIKRKFKNKICKVVGYPRYNHLDDIRQIQEDLSNDFNLDPKKKIVFWTPTHIHYRKETNTNFFPWIDKIEPLLKDYNVIVRPHPKALKLSSNIEKILKEKKFFVDTRGSRKIGNVFKISDLILCDYGGTVFSAIYLSKPIIFLNMDKNSEYIKDLKANISLDLEIRKDLISLDLNSNTEMIKTKILNSLELKYKNKILDIKNKYLSNHKNNSDPEITNFLLSYLQ